MSCKHTIDTAVDEDGCCVSCGADLNPIAMAEARKKSEPTEFVFDPEDPICPVCHESLGLMDGCEWSDNPIENSCRECLFDYIDRLTAELATLKDELTCEECEQSLVDPETGVTALCMTCWNAMVTKLRAEIDLLKAENAIYAPSANAQQNVIRRLTAELKAKDKEIAKLRKAVLEALGDAKALWAGVGNHPASRYAKDVAYYEKVLKGEVTNG